MVVGDDRDCDNGVKSGLDCRCICDKMFRMAQYVSATR